MVTEAENADNGPAIMAIDLQDPTKELIISSHKRVGERNKKLMKNKNGYKFRMPDLKEF